jgi:Concanavalin A-like lectin/glucanases superfamily
MNANVGILSPIDPDPFELSQRYLTDPYARGAATIELTLGPADAGRSSVLPYSFDVFQTKYGVEPADIASSHVLTLRADQLTAPAIVDIDYDGVAGAGTVHMIIPAGTLAGTAFVLAPLPRDPGLVLRQLRESPSPGAGQPSGPDKWGLTILLGNVARLRSVLTGESQVAAATARYVKTQVHLATADGASLDQIGESLGVPRLPPSPYRLDLDTDTLALYHLDDPIAPVLDATDDYSGSNVGAARGVPGKFGSGYKVTSSGGFVIPDSDAFIIDPTAGFTVEMFANLAAAPGAQETFIFAVKRPRFDQADSPGWSLALEPSAAGHDLALTLTDTAGTVVRAAATNVVLPAGWFHVAGIVDPGSKQAAVLLNGVSVGSASVGALGLVETAANIGLGSDLNGVAHFNGSLDEVRFSSVARTDFSSMLGAGAHPYLVDGQTIALYHLDETDDWIDEDRGVHFAINSGAQRGLPARFGNGLGFPGDPLPQAHCPGERDFQGRLRAGSWDRTAGGARIQSGPYARFGYRQGAISERGLDGAMHPVIVNDSGLLTTACYGFTPDDLTHTNNPSQTIAKFQAAGRSVQEAIDYFGEWHGLDDSFFNTQYQAHGISTAHETCAPTAGSATAAQIPGAAEFAFDAATSFTVEAFIRPDAIDDDYPRAIIASRSAALSAGDPNSNEAGWALCLGRYHSIPNNLGWVLGDATGLLLSVYADIDLAADGAFHHVAGVVDRDVGVARLYVDGVEVRQMPLGNLGASAASGPITMGNSPQLNAPYAGLLDEVRISRVARQRYQPVLEESDTRFRQRLAIYQPWRLPVTPAIRRVVQALTLSDPSQTNVVGLLLGSEPVPPQLVQFDVDETDSTRHFASQWFRMIPGALTVGQTITADGTTPAHEPSAADLPSLATNDPTLFVEADGTNYVFSDPDPNSTSRLMTLATAKALERLAARLAVLSSGTKLTIQSAYVPAPPPSGLPPAPITNDNLGRALTVTSASGLDLGVVAALAFETGIAYVAYTSASSLRLVVAPGETLELAVSGASNPGLDLDNRQITLVNQAITVVIDRPKPSAPGGVAADIQWSLLPLASAAGIIGPGSDPSRVSFTGTAPGYATLQARYTLPGGATVLTGSMPIVIAPQPLDGCAVLGGDGTPNVTEAASSGLPDADFIVDYLVTAANPQVDFAATTAPASSRRMQLPLETALGRLAVLAAREPGAPRITVLAAYDPAAGNLQAVGRGMVVAPSSASLAAGRLGALALLAGFSYIERRRYPPSVYVSVPQGDRFQIVSGPLKRLWPNARISGRGELMATEFDAAGPPDAGFNSATLQPFTDPRADFTGVSNQMQPSLATALTALLNALAADGIVGKLQVIQGFTAQDPTLLGVGRAVLTRHPNLPAGRLCGYALQAGFGFVQHLTHAVDPRGPAAYMAAYPAGGGPLNLLSKPDAGSNYVNVYLDTLTELNIRPQLAIKGQLDWGVQAACPAKAVLSTALPDPQNPPGITAKVLQIPKTVPAPNSGAPPDVVYPGAVAVLAAFSLLDFSEPYQFRILAADATGARKPRLTKDQYDDLLNFLDAYHPAGAEVLTKQFRSLVHGFSRPPRWDRLPTAATFQRYRIHR